VASKVSGKLGHFVPNQNFFGILLEKITLVMSFWKFLILMELTGEIVLWKILYQCGFRWASNATAC